MVKTIYWIQQAKKNRNRKYGEKDYAMHQLMHHAIYGENNGNYKTTEKTI